MRACLIPKLDTKAIAKADCFCLRPDKTKAINKYVCFALSNPELFYKFTQMLHGATRPRINTSQLKAIEIPLPPLTEQDEIVRRVDKLFAIADSIEERYIIVSKNSIKRKNLYTLKLLEESCNFVFTKHNTA